MSAHAVANQACDVATACQQRGASCCEKGQLFIPAGEYAAIAVWLEERGMHAELWEMRQRTRDMGDFFLYDQRNRCQFLSDKQLCRLHEPGIKPTECFWWPLHVYADDADQLDIRVCSSCCSAHQALAGSTAEVTRVERDARLIGKDMLLRFRNSYPGMYGTRDVKKLVL